MRCLILASFLLTTPAFAGDVRFNVNFGNWQVGNSWQTTRAYVPYYPVQPYVQYWVVYPQAPPSPPPPPQIIYVEREPAPPPPPQVVVVQLPPVEAPPAPVPQPLPPPPPVSVAAAPAPALPPQVPGPDVFQWTDDDGVVNYSTRVPADARKRAKKIAAPLSSSK